MNIPGHPGANGTFHLCVTPKSQVCHVVNNNMRHQRPQVLVVDGEQEVLDTMTTVLGKAGFGCRCCTTAEAAGAAARTASPDLIICDLHLGGESGLETCQRIKQYPGLEHVPVMFLSNAQLPDVISHSHTAGGSYCLRKPLAPKVLIELIDQALAAPVR